VSLKGLDAKKNWLAVNYQSWSKFDFDFDIWPWVPKRNDTKSDHAGWLLAASYSYAVLTVERCGRGHMGNQEELERPPLEDFTKQLSEGRDWDR
jgi:hypothetical protein